MVLNQGDFQTYWLRGLFPGISHQNSRNRSVLNWNLKTPHGLFTFLRDFRFSIQIYNYKNFYVFSAFYTRDFINCGG